MKKIGFIDYYLDEWHANNYPQWIKERADGKYEVTYAYGKIDSPKGGMTNIEWADKMGVKLLDTIEEVVEKSDVLIVLSPDNPEMHKELCALPLASGKPVYVDKTFAPDKKTAEEIFAHADSHGTPCYSSSALRFSSELKDIETDKIFAIHSEGPGNFDVYSIHLIEPVVSLMKTRAKRVMAISDKAHPSLVIEFDDKRLAHLCQYVDKSYKITIVDDENNAEEHPINSKFFELFIEDLIAFFDTGIISVPHEQTIDVIAVCEAGRKAFENPFNWVEV